VPDRTAYRWSTEPKVRAKIKAYRRRVLDRAVGNTSMTVGNRDARLVSAQG